MSAIQAAIFVLLACVGFSGCSRHRPPSAPSKDSAPQGETFAFDGGTTMRVRERTGESLRGVHIVKKTPDGNLETTDAEKGRISKGADSGITRVTLYDAHVDLGSKGRFTAGDVTMDLVNKLDQDALERIAHDLRHQQLTNQMRRAGQ